MLAVATLVVGGVAAVAACAGSGPVPAGGLPMVAPAPSRPLRTPAVEVLRERGSAGTRQRLTIAPDGGWMFFPAPGSTYAGTLNTGRLTPAQHAELARLLAGPELAAEAADPAEGTCPGRDRFVMTVTGTSATWTDCLDDRPALAALIALIRTATPI
jgi:hypothetical protein